MKRIAKKVTGIPSRIMERVKLIFQLNRCSNAGNRWQEPVWAHISDPGAKRPIRSKNWDRSVGQTAKRLLRSYRLGGFVLTLLASPTICGAASFPKSSEYFPYMVQDAPLQKVIREFSQFTGIPSKTYEVLNHKVTIDNTDGTVADFLNEVSHNAEVSWWYDGKTIHFERPEMVSSESLELSGIKLEQLKGEVERLGFDISAFPLQESENGKWVYLRGPQEFVATVSDLVETVIESKRVSVAALPKIIVGSHVKP